MSAMVVKAYKNIRFIISVAVVIVSILYHNELKFYYECFKNQFEPHKSGVYTKADLAQFDGIQQNNLFLAVLGTVFDVTEGKIHYKKGAAYNYFIGKDGSRALITGHFEDESAEMDHVMDLSCNDLFTVVHWRNTFREKYIEVGVLTGRFFDHSGEETAYAKEINNKIKQCEKEKEYSRNEDQEYPPCNIAWSADDGTRVWCTTSSGGVQRSWTGVPRQLYTPGVKKPRCVCINTVEQDSLGLIKEYDDCPKSSTECIFKF